MLFLTAIVAVSVFPQGSAQTLPSITINEGASYTNSTTVTLTLSTPNATQMSFSNDNSTWSDWENFTATKTWTLPTEDGNYTVYAQFLDSENNISTVDSSIVLDTTAPYAEPYATWYSDDYRTVYFDATYSTDNLGIANCTWDFGDGNLTNAIVVLHTYTEIGNYNASLTVQDFAGNNATAYFSVTIPDLASAATPTPTPTVTIPPTTHPTSTPTPTAQPTQTPGFELTSDSMILIAVVVAVGVVCLLVVVVFWKRWKTAPPPSQQ